MQNPPITGAPHIAVTIGLIAAAFALATGCSGGEKHSGADPEVTAPEPQAADTSAASAPSMRPERIVLRDIERAHVFGDILLTSQPNERDFQAAALSGVTTVINLRKPGEMTDFDEEALMKLFERRYYNPSFKEPEEMTDEILDTVRGLLAGSRRGKLLLHCSSANRVGAVWLAHRVLDHGLDYDTALEEAKMVGLTKLGHEDAAKAYIQRILEE